MSTLPTTFAPFTGSSLDDGDAATVGAWTFTARITHDSYTGAPWEEHDGHGPVTDWESRDKAPGELVLNSDRDGTKRFYDFAEACRIARRDGWGAEGDEGMTARQKAAHAARADFDRLRRWCDDQWHWCGVVVTVSVDGVELASESLWGIESDAGAYLVDVANELASQALEPARERAQAIRASLEAAAA